jgi:hypothetical protein
MTEDYTAQFDRLESAHEDALWRLAEAEEDNATARAEIVQKVTAPLDEFHDAIQYKRPSATPEADRPEVEADLTKSILASLQDAGLTVKPVTLFGVGKALVIQDNYVEPKVTEAKAEVADLARQIKDFKRDHAADLEAERQEAEADAYREAIANNNLDAARRIFNREGEDRTGVFTTDDLARPEVHKRSPVLR